MIKLFQSPSLNYLKYLVHRLTVGISPKLEINRCFKKTFGHKANLVNPQSLIEKSIGCNYIVIHDRGLCSQTNIVFVSILSLKVMLHFAKTLWSLEES